MKKKKTLREIFDLYVQCRLETGAVVTKSSFQPVKSIIYFVEKKRGTEYLTQSLFKEWREERTRTYNAMTVVRNFLFFARERGFLNIRCPKPVYPRHPKVRVLDQPLKKSVVSDMMTQFFKWREKTIPLNINYKYILIRFNNYCQDTWYEAKELTDEMVEKWCEQGEYETATTRNVRVYPLSAFLKYAISKGLKNIKLPKKLPTIQKKGLRSHIFTKEELSQFFALTKDFHKYDRESITEFRRRKLVNSVIYRFLYSTGMRLTDTVSLKRTDVDLKKGFISFDTYNGRGHNTIAVAPSLLAILKKYDKAMEKLFPNRLAFFPNRDKKCLSPSGVERYFTKLWYKISDERVKVSDFRVTFAVENINSWDYDGTDWTLQLLHLSRAMGHRSIKETQNYLTLVPRYREILQKLSSRNLSKLIPDIYKIVENEEESN